MSEQAGQSLMLSQRLADLKSELARLDEQIEGSQSERVADFVAKKEIKAQRAQICDDIAALDGIIRTLDRSRRQLRL